jgi:hypothetical protein
VLPPVAGSGRMTAYPSLTTLIGGKAPAREGEQPSKGRVGDNPPTMQCVSFDDCGFISKPFAMKPVQPLLVPDSSVSDRLLGIRANFCSAFFMACRLPSAKNRRTCRNCPGGKQHWCTNRVKLCSELGWYSV